MGKPTGGRGHKAKYDSTHARIPEPIKPLVESLADQYRSYVAEGDCLEFESKSLLPKIPAIYFVLEGEEIVYVGQTKNLCHRWKSHHLLKEFKGATNSLSIAWLQCENTKLLRSIETILIESIAPKFNISIRGETSTTFQPAWKHGKTQTIRVPIALADQLLDVARNMDEGREITVTQAKDEEIRQLKEQLGKLIICCLELLRSQQNEQAITLDALDRYIEEESQRDRKGNQYGKEFKTDSTRWDKFNQFKKWVKAKTTQIQEVE